jgi:hypothetical protein
VNSAFETAGFGGAAEAILAPFCFARLCDVRAESGCNQKPVVGAERRSA